MESNPPSFRQITVQNIKYQLRGRRVPFPSTGMKKQELYDLLMANWHQPVDPMLLAVEEQERKEKAKKDSKAKQAKAKRNYWRKDQPVRKLLYFEFKEGNTPLDPNEMGPNEIYCKHMEAPEFEGVELDDHFTECLKSLRKQTMKEEPLLKWNECHPARNLLFNEMQEGNIPTDKTQMCPEEIWNRHCDTPEFKMRGMKCGETFKRRLAAMRKLVGKDRNRAEEDLQHLVAALKNHPPPTHNHRGEPQWNGSRAQELLKRDIADGEHVGKKPMELWAKRPEYAPHKKIFKNKMCQVVKTNKCLCTLKHDAEQKLRKNMKKMNLEDWGYGKPIEEL